MRRLAEDHCKPLESLVLRGSPITDEDGRYLAATAQKVGLWGLTLSKDLGVRISARVDNVVVTEENNRTLVPIPFGGDPSVFVACEGEQRERYLFPCVEG